jgi:hypothetical protein
LDAQVGPAFLSGCLPTWHKQNYQEYK